MLLIKWKEDSDYDKPFITIHYIEGINKPFSYKVSCILLCWNKMKPATLILNLRRISSRRKRGGDFCFDFTFHLMSRVEVNVIILLFYYAEREHGCPYRRLVGMDSHVLLALFLFPENLSLKSPFRNPNRIRLLPGGGPKLIPNNSCLKFTADISCFKV